MSEDEVLEMARQALLISIQIGAPILMIGLVVGVAIALVQALTQVQEITLVFVPKILAIFLALFVFLPGMMRTLTVFMETIADKIVGLGVMNPILTDFFTTGVLAFMLTFVRIGTAVMIMPGLGDSFVPDRIRLHVALGLTLCLFPMVLPYMPHPVPGTFMLFSLIVMEFIIGLFFGTIARILMMALDTAGMVVSTSSGLSSAQLFNPSLATQGSLIGAFLSVTGVIVLFSLNLHHLLIAGVVESYNLFPIGSIPDPGSMANLMAHTVSESFAIGIRIGAPFIVLTLVLYVGMGVLSRLMPQIQVFMLALPLQILLSLVMLMMTLSAAYLYWAHQFEQGMVFFLSNAGSGG